MQKVSEGLPDDDTVTLHLLHREGSQAIVLGSGPPAIARKDDETTSVVRVALSARGLVTPLARTYKPRTLPPSAGSPVAQISSNRATSGLAEAGMARASVARA